MWHSDFPATTTHPLTLPPPSSQEEERELAQWEQDVAVSRSQGQFFQSLYQADKKRPVGEDAQQLKVRHMGGWVGVWGLLRECIWVDRWGWGSRAAAQDEGRAGGRVDAVLGGGAKGEGEGALHGSCTQGSMGRLTTRGESEGAQQS